MSKILIIEDETAVASFLRKGLSEEGYDVSVAFDSASGMGMMSTASYDLIILDIMLPDKNGVEVCRELRSRGVMLPVLFLTALGTAENIALGLDAGADDYLVKPFKFIELNARIKALLRRAEHRDSETVSKKIYKIDDLLVDDDAKQVLRGGVPLTLTAKEYRLLLTLIQNKGKVMSRMELLEAAWDVNFNLGTNVVDVYINYLRKKIDADRQVKLIHTVIGMGYMIKES